MHELITNLHIHTIYSDGSGSHASIAQAALKTGLDVIFITDHNVLVQGIEGYLEKNDRRLLVLVGEEVHDRYLKPQKNHLLILGAGQELSPLAKNPQWLIDQANHCGGLTFLAHPHDPALPLYGEEAIPWDDWDLHGFTGLELWNGFSELKSRIRGKADALFYALFPQFVARGPHPKTFQKWDELLAQGRKVAVIGGSDAHALRQRMGPLRRIVFPYEYHFQAVNTHLLTPQPLSGDLEADRQIVLDALRKGRSFIGYDYPYPTRGFQFICQGFSQSAQMGEHIFFKDGVTFNIRLPLPTECRLIKDGAPVKTWRGQEFIAYNTSQPGVYRVECYLNTLGRRRAWIFSNPIYTQKSR